MKENEDVKLLLSHGALLKGHFKLASGKHSEYYVQCAKLYENPSLFHELTKKLADLWKNVHIDRVIGPAMGAIVLAYELAFHLGTKFSFVERRNSRLQLRRNFTLNQGENILICEDVVTTGGTIYELIDLLKEYDVKIIGITSIIDRSSRKIFEHLIFKSLFRLKIKTYDMQQCPLCERNIPLTIPGIKANQ